MILVYHHVVPTDWRRSNVDPNDGWEFRHSPDGLERQLRELMRRGYRFISLGEMVAKVRDNGHAPSNDAVITFDDGWRDAHEFALPVLTTLGLTATFFLTTEHFRRRIEDPIKMTPSQVRELLAAGMTIGGQSRTHPNLTALSEDRARDEIAGCKADLEGLLGRGVETFAYPGGAFNRRVVDLTQEAGYAAACSVLSPARNDRSSLFWLFRDAISEDMNSVGDRYRLSHWARRALEWRVRRKLRQNLT